MGNFRSLTTGAIMSVFAGTGAVSETYGKYETPRYEVATLLGNVELRRYAPYIIAEVAVSGTRRQALNRGFRELAGYIFGGNVARAGVDMTAPVAQSRRIDMTSPVAQTANDGAWTVTFMMPSDWTIDTLPVPNSAAVRFRQMPARTEAVWQFSGRATDAALAEVESRLRDAIVEAGWQAEGAALYYFYDDPMTLPWNRRNEVSFVIAN